MPRKLFYIKYEIKPVDGDDVDGGGDDDDDSTTTSHP